jgi:hypothetical protein
MKVINNRFYIGYEGEPEIQFISQDIEDKQILCIWEGYFDEIMVQFKPTDGKWTGLAYNYHMYTGWYDNTLWKIECPKNVLEQFNSIDKDLLNEETAQVLLEICAFLEKGIKSKHELFMNRD